MSPTAFCDVCVTTNAGCEGVNNDCCKALSVQSTCESPQACKGPCKWMGSNYGCMDYNYYGCAASSANLQPCFTGGLWNNSNECKKIRKICQTCTNNPTDPKCVHSLPTFCPQGAPSDGKKYPCCGCGYSPSSIYYTSWLASNRTAKAADIIWNQDKIFPKAKLKPGFGPLKHFILDDMEGKNSIMDKFIVMRTCALLSIETSHGMGTADCLYPNYPANATGPPNMIANCGIPNAFGTWNSSKGLDGFKTLTTSVKNGPSSTEFTGIPFGSVGVFSYPLLPLSWLESKGFPYIPTKSDTANEPTNGGGTSSNNWWKWVVGGVVGLLLIILGVIWYRNRG